MKHYLISVDGGGTKTEFCSRCMESGDLVSGIYGSANYKSSSEETAVESIVGWYQSFCKQFQIASGEIQGIVFGFAGCDTADDLEFYRKTVAKIGLDARRTYVCNDSEMVLEATVDEGVCVVAGTGAIAMGLTREGKKARTGGWGIPLSDEGSGWWIGAEMLKHYLRWCDELEEENPYFDRITRWLNVDSPRAGAERVTTLSNREIASLAHDIMDCAAAGYELCDEIVQQSAAWIATLITTTCRTLGFDPERDITVLTMGSLFCDERYTAMVRSNVEAEGLHRLQYTRPEGTPASFGLRLAQKLYGQAGYSFH